ncbi:MAG: hypothetical protein WAO91_07530 [Candidatus Nitrosotenuis sp.]
MSQILLGRPKNTVLYSEIYFPRNKNVLRSSAMEALCYVCKQGLEDGKSLTAKQIGSKTVLVCSLHNK